MKLLSALLLASFLVGISTAQAHEPHYVGGETAITISDPEVSKAFYGELTGQPIVYQIVSTKEFPLYISILSPDIDNSKKDFSAEVTDTEGKTVTILNGQTFVWKQWYEEFAGDSYWKGPEYSATVPAGTYTITVSSPSNTGKYVLAPGQIEAFSLTGTPSTIKELYATKTKFFNKSWYSIFEGIIGKSLLGVLAVTTFFILGFVYVVLRRPWLKSRSY